MGKNAHRYIKVSQKQIRASYAATCGRTKAKNAFWGLDCDRMVFVGDTKRWAFLPIAIEYIGLTPRRARTPIALLRCSKMGFVVIHRACGEPVEPRARTPIVILISNIHQPSTIQNPLPIMPVSHKLASFGYAIIFNS